MRIIQIGISFHGFKILPNADSCLLNERQFANANGILQLVEFIQLVGRAPYFRPKLPQSVPFDSSPGERNDLACIVHNRTLLKRAHARPFAVGDNVLEE